MARPSANDPELRQLLPEAPIDRWTVRIRRFLMIESSSGLLLLACTLIALFLANSRWSAEFANFWHQSASIQFGSWSLTKDLLHLVNDGLMTVFFFVIGLEIKREIIAGELRNPRKAVMPILAAIGGMVAPALIYYGLYRFWGMDPAVGRGWAIPMATDIAFVVGILAIFGDRVPFQLRVLLLTLAIVDDLGAVLMIAFVFTEQIFMGSLGYAGAAMLLVIGMNRMGIRNVGLYTIVGAFAWVNILKAGIHPTVAGVLLGLLTPSRPWVSSTVLQEVLERLQRRLPKTGTDDEISARLISQARFAVNEASSPLERLEYQLHPWSAFLIMPIFALANAGIAIQPAAISNPVSLAIAAGLALGKPLGILACCGLGVALRMAELPKNVTWGHLTAGACLAGIGFTMSLFLAGLALPEESLSAGKLGTLLGSIISGSLGIGLMLAVTRPAPADSTVSLDPAV